MNLMKFHQRNANLRRHLSIKTHEKHRKFATTMVWEFETISNHRYRRNKSKTFAPTMVTPPQTTNIFPAEIPNETKIKTQQEETYLTRRTKHR
jgi:predicted component of viral defense system (DUF524 family)